MQRCSGICLSDALYYTMVVRHRIDLGKIGEGKGWSDCRKKLHDAISVNLSSLVELGLIQGVTIEDAKENGASVQPEDLMPLCFTDTEVDNLRWILSTQTQ